MPDMILLILEKYLKFMWRLLYIVPGMANVALVYRDLLFKVVYIEVARNALNINFPRVSKVHKQRGHAAKKKDYKMEIKIETSAYNERRYGKPWIATVDFSNDRQGTFKWGDWIGDSQNGGSGTLVIDAAPSIGDKGEAYAHYVAGKKRKIDIDALNAEKIRLIARLDEVLRLLEENSK